MKILSSIILLLLVVGCTSTSDNNEAPFTLTSSNNKEIHVEETSIGLNFKEFQNKRLLLVIFGHNCPPCLKEIPALIKLKKEKNDLEIVAIEVQNYSDEELRKFAKTKGINYTLLSREKNREFLKYIAKKSDWLGAIPFMMIFDKQGELKKTHLGGIGFNQLEKFSQL